MVEKSQTGGFFPSLADPLRQFGARVHDWLAPASDASSDKDVYRISMELPGVAEEDVTLTVKDGVVTVAGEKKSSREEKGDTWYFSERQYGAFSRSFRLPADADDSKAEAALRDGILTVTVPKAPETGPEGARKIAISKG